MANKMLIDATHPEETRVVVLRGNRVEEFDFESAHRKQLRGNIYLAKVTRVEPSLQAAFVDYGGNRHGFLAFSEIHPDYYQIPIADRQALIEEDERAQRAVDDDIDRRSRRHRHRDRAARRGEEVVRGEPAEILPDETAPGEAPPDEAAAGVAAATAIDEPAIEPVGLAPDDSLPPDETVVPHGAEPAADAYGEPAAAAPETETADQAEADAVADEVEPTEAAPSPAASGNTEIDADEAAAAAIEADGNGAHADNVEEIGGGENGGDDEAAEEAVESVGGADALEEVPDRAPRYRRQYKIQEVIKRRQVMLVQVVKEERGTKGAALTTYLSLAGRYSVLMPNTARGGGISRKITSGEDRARLKEVAQELEVPEGMGVILRTAGASRTKTEIKRDFEYLLRMWETVRDLTLKSTAPKLVYEEGSLIKRSIRDLYSKDIDDVIVAGNDGYHEAKDFMRMLMPSHAKNVRLYSDTQPLLSRYGVENQLDAMFSPVVQLRSGGYIVLNQAEALVAIDVNSGRATREHHIEDTALKTNLEAADEIARQLRLRDLAGLIVIDFIDMDENRNNRAVERRLKECLKHDRARIQVGRISHFGLLEMSRQRIRTSVLESSTEKCPYCGGSGHVRSVSSLALQVLRALEEQLMRAATHNLIARTRPDVALYVLNQKRAHLRALEERFAITITIAADETVTAPQAFVIERGDQVHTIEAARALAEQYQASAAPLEEEDDLEAESAPADEELEGADGAEEAEESEAAEHQGDGGSRRRRRRRRRGRDRDGGERGRREQIPIHEETAEASGEYLTERETEGPAAQAGVPAFAAADDDGELQGDEAERSEADDRPEYHGQRTEQHAERRRRRRGRRGGRRNRHERNGERFNELGEHRAETAEPDLEPDDLDRPAAAGPDLKEAAADLDAPPGATADRAEPAPTAAGPFAPPTEPEPPRRRSTVREPAPFGSSGENAPPAPPAPPAASASSSAEPAREPAATENAAENADQPRRTGWWSRRFG